jgi:hypothetical protein
MTLVGALTFTWLLTPFAAGALVSSSAAARRLIAEHLAASLAVGWTGVALLVGGAATLEHPIGVVAFAVGGPLAGLSFWSRSGGGPGDDPPDEPDPEPLPPDFDWALFEREFATHQARRPVASR